MYTPRCLLGLSALAAGLCSNLSPAAGDPTGRTIGVQVEHTTTDFGKLHINAALLGYQLSSPTGGLISSASVTLELHKRMAISGHLTGPLLAFAGGEHAPWRGEGMLHLWSRNSYDVEKERVDLSSEQRGDKIHTEWIDMPMVNHNRSGLGAGIIYNIGDANVDIDDDEQIFNEHTLIAVVGLHAMNSTGYTVNVDGFGRRANYRWMLAGLDVMYGLLQDSDAPEFGSRWGGRLWAETIFFKPVGISGRLEIGKYPGHIGWVLGASLGFGLHR